MIYQAFEPEGELVSAIVFPTVLVAEDSRDAAERHGGGCGSLQRGYAERCAGGD